MFGFLENFFSRTWTSRELLDFSRTFEFSRIFVENLGLGLRKGVRQERELLENLGLRNFRFLENFGLRLTERGLKRGGEFGEQICSPVHLHLLLVMLFQTMDKMYVVLLHKYSLRQTCRKPCIYMWSAVYVMLFQTMDKMYVVLLHKYSLRHTCRKPCIYMRHHNGITFAYVQTNFVTFSKVRI